MDLISTSISNATLCTAEEAAVRPRNARRQGNADASGLPLVPSDCALRCRLAMGRVACQTLRGAAQVCGQWPDDHPLPLPEWAEHSSPVLLLDGLGDFNETVNGIEAILQQVLEDNNYNTVGNVLTFYRQFKRSQCSSLFDYFQHYDPPISAEHHTCVGLALDLWRHVAKRYPDLQPYFYLVSCEESIGIFDQYPGLRKQLDVTKNILEKEHVLLAMRFALDGRVGMMLCDPGYHVGHVIIVMRDEMRPHTGWFTQCKEPNVEKCYNYAYSQTNRDFIEWTEKVWRKGAMVEEVHSLIYASKPYLSGIDVTERRNLVYSFRSMLSRNCKGQLIAGIYFKVSETDDTFTLFYQDNGKKRLKLNFAVFQDAHRISDQMLAAIEKCNGQLNMAPRQLLEMLQSLHTMISDKFFIQQMLAINDCVNNMTEG